MDNGIDETVAYPGGEEGDECLIIERVQDRGYHGGRRGEAPPTVKHAPLLHTVREVPHGHDVPQAEQKPSHEHPGPLVVEISNDTAVGDAFAVPV